MLALSDDELDLLTRMAEPLPPLLRSAFLETVSVRVGALSSDGIGLGSLHRIAREVQLDLLKHSGPVAIGRGGGSKGVGKYSRPNALRR